MAKNKNDNDNTPQDEDPMFDGIVKATQEAYARKLAELHKQWGMSK